MKKIFFILAIVFVIPIGIYGQEKSTNVLWLNNGKKIEMGKYQIVKNNFGVEIIQYKSLKNKTRVIGSDEVFSIIEKNGNEIIVYSQNLQLGDSFNIIEMRAFVQGQTDANLNFKSPSTVVCGVITASVSILTLNPLLAIPLGGGYSSGIGLTKASKEKIIIPPEYENNQYYLVGYKKECKHKRMRNAIVGYGIGLVVGFTTFTVCKGGFVGKNN